MPQTRRQRIGQAAGHPLGTAFFGDVLNHNRYFSLLHVISEIPRGRYATVARPVETAPVWPDSRRTV
ncbi:hypothetical protein D3C87_1872460 [compost metagenome]